MLLTLVVEGDPLGFSRSFYSLESDSAIIALDPRRYKPASGEILRNGSVLESYGNIWTL